MIPKYCHAYKIGQSQVPCFFLYVAAGVQAYNLRFRFHA